MENMQNRLRSWPLWLAIAALAVWVVKLSEAFDISQQVNDFMNVALPVVVGFGLSIIPQMQRKYNGIGRPCGRLFFVVWLKWVRMWVIINIAQRKFANVKCIIREIKQAFPTPIICGNARSSDIRYISAARQFGRMPLQMKRNACMCNKNKIAWPEIRQPVFSSTS